MSPTKVPPQIRALLTVEQARAVLVMSREKLYGYINSGELRSIKIGNSRRIEQDAIEEFLDARRQKSA
jgi:excisionase family DNA binding protein